MNSLNYKHAAQLMKAATGYNNTPKVTRSIYDTLVTGANAPIQFTNMGGVRIPQLSPSAHRLVRAEAKKNQDAAKLLRVAQAIRGAIAPQEAPHSERAPSPKRRGASKRVKPAQRTPCEDKRIPLAELQGSHYGYVNVKALRALLDKSPCRIVSATGIVSELLVSRGELDPDSFDITVEGSGDQFLMWVMAGIENGRDGLGIHSPDSIHQIHPQGEAKGHTTFHLWWD